MSIQPDPDRFAPSASASSDPHSVAPAARHDGWTPARQAAFLRELAASRNVAAAARSVGMSRQSAYKLRARLRGQPFDIAWAAAFQCHFDALAEAAMERALHGVEVPHFHRGEMVGTSRRFDERLTLGLLAMRHGFLRPPPPPTSPAYAYETDDLAALIERVEEGPESWDGEDDEDDEDEDGEDEPAIDPYWSAGAPRHPPGGDAFVADDDYDLG